MPRSGSDELRVALSWRDLLHKSSLGDVELCVWSPESLPSEFGDAVCWHRLALPQSIDRYVRGPHASGIWTPWGNKSGPNFQFFMQLESMRRSHPEPWLFQIEGDTFSVGDRAEFEIAALLDRYQDAWIIGAVNHPIVLPALDPRMHQHINGAAIYRLDSDEFSSFQRRTWIPSLIETVSRNPEMAYDCLSGPGLRDELGVALKDAWNAHDHRLVRTHGMINASSIVARGPEDPRLLDDDLELARNREGVDLWFLHTKIANAGTPRRRLFARKEVA